MIGVPGVAARCKIASMNQLDIFPSDEARSPHLAFPETTRLEVIRAMARLLLEQVLPREADKDQEAGDE
jgi:hypothetical protein